MKVVVGQEGCGDGLGEPSSASSLTGSHPSSTAGHDKCTGHPGHFRNRKMLCAPVSEGGRINDALYLCNSLLGTALGYKVSALAMLGRSFNQDRALSVIK